jgi:polyisoprenoid-binding protein YceI
MTKQNILRIALLVLLLAVAAFVLITCSNNAPAPTVAPTEVPAEAATDAAPDAATDAAPEPTVQAATETQPDDSAADSATDTAASESTTDAAGGSALAPVTFTIDQSSSEARFLINESLLGIPTEVKGVTNQITGTIAIDVADPARTTLSPITIDARDLRTDRDLRNRAIRRFILESGKDEFRYITFTPAAIEGLPAQAAAPGESYAFQITGDLQIKDVTQPATFDVELTANSETEVTGTATATILRSDFNLSIPSAPGVADVTDEVRLELAFTATAE